MRASLWGGAERERTPFAGGLAQVRSRITPADIASDTPLNKKSRRVSTSHSDGCI